ncbi:polysaccharide pyruvyl transferase CsaB [Coprothermobacteraceae bacterium]|nr:polysaccharide pyruvyl transferase CsaB [Coprothermobacteraceae bacterium]
MKRLLLVGYWGGFNVGDEGFLEIVLPFFDGAAQITVASKNPYNTAKAFSVRSVKSESLKLALEIARSDTVLEGPGGLYQDVTSLRSLIFYAGVVLLGRMLRKKVILYGVGIGPVRTRLGEWMTCLAFKSADKCFVRDSYSMEWLAKRRLRAFHAADVVFILASTDYSGYSPSKEVTLYVPSHGWKSLDLDAVNGEVMIFFPKKDLEIARLVAGDYIDGLNMNMKEIIDLFKQYRGAVVGRLHAAVLCTIAGLPFVAIPYDVKLEEFVRHLSSSIGYPHDAFIASSISEANEKLLTLLADAPSLSSKLVDFALAEKGKALHMMEVVSKEAL